MTVSDCVQDPNFSSSGAVTLTGSDQNITFLSTLFGTPSLPSLQGQLAQSGSGSSPANASIRLWLVSGPGPTYIQEVVLAELAGASSGPRSVAGIWQLSRLLPIAGRVWSPVTDQVQLQVTNGWAGPAGTTTHYEFRVCSVTATVEDCCSELNAKLDQLLDFVAKTYFTNP